MHKFWDWGTKLKASAGHIWLAGYMLCMPVLYDKVKGT